MAAAGGLKRYDLITVKCDFIRAFIKRHHNNRIYFKFIPSFVIRVHEFPHDITISGESHSTEIIIPAFEHGLQHMHVIYKFSISNSDYAIMLDGHIRSIPHD